MGTLQFFLSETSVLPFSVQIFAFAFQCLLQFLYFLFESEKSCDLPSFDEVFEQRKGSLFCLLVAGSQSIPQ